jgi:hypothetical protein
MKRILFMTLLTLIPGVCLAARAEPALAIRVYDRSGLLPFDVDLATRELRGIYRSAGIDATVRNCQMADSCHEEFGVNEVGVRVLPGTCPSDARRLAVAFAAPGAYLSTVYAGAVIEAATRTNVSIGRVLGYAMTHEVGHLFGLSHSRLGVMAAGWTDADYRAMGGLGMLFTQAEAAAIHSRVAEKQQSLDASAALLFFPRSELASPESLLARLRPPKLLPEFRTRIIASLPREGELLPTARERSTMSATDRILAFHDRVGAVELKLIDTFQAGIGLHGRSVILISRRAIKLLSASELQALVAHELGHDYFWEEYEQAAAQNRKHVLREIELRCDAIALLTLRALNLDSNALGSALTKIDRFNAQFGTPMNIDNYVSTVERTRFHNTLLRIANAR